MFVTDAEAGDPPLVQIGPVAIRDVDAAPAAHLTLIGVIELLEAVEVVQVPANGGILPVDFERVSALWPRA